MKRALSLLLIVVLMFSLVACGSKTEPTVTDANETTGTETEAAAPEVTAIEATISVQVESSWLEYYQAAAARVIANNPDAVINFIETPSFDHLDIIDKTSVENTDVADVFALPADRIYGLAKNEALASMDAKAMAEAVGGFGDYDAGLGGNFKIGEDYLAFPMNIETLINFANTANAATAGIDLTKEIEFTTLKNNDMLVPAFNAWFGVALTNSAGIELLGKNADGSLFSDLTADWADLAPEKQAAFTSLFDYWKLHNTANDSLWDLNTAWGFMDTEFTTGGTNSIRLEGPWSTGSLSAFAGEGKDLAILPINQVTLNGKPLLHWKGGWGLGINARIEGEESQMMLAQAFIQEVLNPEFAVDFFKATGKIMENVDPAVYMSSDMSDIDKTVVKAVIDSYANAPARPLFTEWGSVWDTWQNGLISWASVKPATVEEAYAEVQASFKAMMLNF